MSSVQLCNLLPPFHCIVQEEKEAVTEVFNRAIEVGSLVSLITS